MKTLVISSRAGGVGKSAVAVLLCQYLSRHGKRLLAIDLDHQGHLGARLCRWGEPAVTLFSSDALITGDQVLELDARSLTMVPGNDRLLEVTRQTERPGTGGSRLRAFLECVDGRFDVCVIDTASIPDLRLESALSAADFVLHPLRLDDPTMDNVASLFDDPRVGLGAMRERNPKLRLLGILPNMVEPTPFQKRNLARLIDEHAPMLIRCSGRDGDYVHFRRRSAIEQAQMSGSNLWNSHATATRHAWHEVEPGLASIAAALTSQVRP